jgi:DHA2 family multidrug resistance protein
MVVLDGAIANVAIPTIAGNLGVSPNQGTWVITSFAVANAVSMPLTGWMAQRFGQVRLFVGALLLFVLASLLCGLAPSIELLVFFRIIQGAAAGPMVPMSQALLLSIVPRAQAGMAMAMWGLVIMVAPVMGPVVGGWLSDTFSWPWIFLINVPFGLVAAGYTWKLYRDRETPTQRRPIDGIGLALLVLWVGALQIMLDKGRELDWFDSSFIVMLATLSVVGFAFFIIWERYEKNPIVDLSLFRERSFATSTVVLSLGHGALLGNTVLIPLWLQTQLGYSATDAGLVMAPVGLLSIL